MQNAVYFTQNMVIKRLTRDEPAPHDPATEDVRVVANSFTLANGPWKFDPAWNQIPATQEEWKAANADKPTEDLKAALQQFHQSALAYQAARQAGQVTNMASYLPLFDDILRDLDKALRQVWQNMQS